MCWVEVLPVTTARTFMTTTARNSCTHLFNEHITGPGDFLFSPRGAGSPARPTARSLARRNSRTFTRQLTKRTSPTDEEEDERRNSVELSLVPSRPVLFPLPGTDGRFATSLSGEETISRSVKIVGDRPKSFVESVEMRRVHSNTTAGD